MSDFSVVEEVIGRGIAGLHVKGFLDAHSFEEFDAALNELFERSIYKVLVDLTDLEYVSSAGAGVLIAALSEAKEHSGELVLLNPRESVREVFDLLGLTQLFRMTGDRDEAVSILQQ
jgi:anti-sigma B factor antagonist